MINGVPGLGNVVELAEVVRNGFVESRHFGLAVALDPDGKQLFAAGDVNAVVLPRSTAKPLQAVGCIVAGAELDGEETAIGAGSHTGEDRHVALVDRLLAAAGLGRDALGCPPDRPEDEATRFQLIAEGIEPEKVRMNCSGKHAAMLKATVAQGDDPTGYLSPLSTVQRTIAAEIERLTESSTGIVTVDGCGAPLLGMPLSGLARAFSHLATAAADTADSQVAAAMRKYPELVGGKGHQNSEVMRLLPGVIAKGGAEGVIAMATVDGHAVAVKVIDGSPRATTALALTLLQKCGLDVSPAATLINLPILGGGKPVGEIRPTI
ncbi:asparaginase [Streptomyces sp. SID13031]|uniref:asparaginase n=1 Tax=Streptomyces sp. SID13031 TaxID=2706046 RepID=UPI0013CAAF29|nr:asparaginase [Streptomyces sp. SID13031]NEA37039.1 asparaginase [Streptomyces sp. SID13031]